MKQGKATEVIALRDAAHDFVMSDTFDDYVQIAFWAKDWNVDRALELMDEWMAGVGLVVDDAGPDFDTETFLYNAYVSTEKGLS